MSDTFSVRLAALGRQALAERLAQLCASIGVEESSVLVPADPGRLVFFVSTNPALMADSTPPVPIVASFTGLVFSTGQAVAMADAAGRTGHFKEVDDLLAKPTRAFAAVPIFDRSGTVLGVLTLANRPVTPSRRAEDSFSPADLVEAGRVAADIAEGLALLRGLGTASARDDTAETGGALAALGVRDRRAVGALIAALAASGGLDNGVA